MMVLPKLSLLPLLFFVPIAGSIVLLLKLIAAWAGRFGAARARRVARYCMGPPALWLEVVAFGSGIDLAKEALEGHDLGSYWMKMTLVPFGVGMALWVLMPLMRWAQPQAMAQQSHPPTEEVYRHASPTARVRSSGELSRGLRVVWTLWELFHGALLLVALGSVAVVLLVEGDPRALLVLVTALAAYSVARANAGPMLDEEEQSDRPSLTPKLDRATTVLEAAATVFLVIAAVLGVLVIAGC